MNTFDKEKEIPMWTTCSRYSNCAIAEDTYFAVSIVAGRLDREGILAKDYREKCTALGRMMCELCTYSGT